MRVPSGDQMWAMTSPSTSSGRASPPASGRSHTRLRPSRSETKDTQRPSGDSLLSYSTLVDVTSGEQLGSQVVSPGVIRYAFVELGLCAGISGARYTTTTEVYPDSPRATPAQCNDAQAAAVRAAIDYGLQHPASP